MQFWLRVLCGLTGVLSAAIASAGHDQGVTLSGSVTRFNFSEYNDEGIVSVDESGYVYGSKLDFRKRWDRLYVGAKFDVSKGTVAYNGQRLLGDMDMKPYETTTTETIMDGSVQIGRVYESWRSYDFSVVYAGLGYHQWVRDIKSRILFEDNITKKILGPFEVYRWAYFQVGARGFLFRTDRMFVLVDFNLLRTLAPSMTSDTKGLLDKQHLELGSHFSGRVSIPVRYEVFSRWLLTLEPFYEAWDIGRSQHAVLTDEGVMSTFGAHQPRSASRNYGVDLGIQFEFN